MYSDDYSYYVQWDAGERSFEDAEAAKKFEDNLRKQGIKTRRINPHIHLDSDPQ